MEDIKIEMCNMFLDKTLNAMIRGSIETIVTIHVHQVDITNKEVKIVKKSKDGINDFDWQKQLRNYWNDDINHCVISVTDVDFCYS